MRGDNEEVGFVVCNRRAPHDGGVPAIADRNGLAQTGVEESGAGRYSQAHTTTEAAPHRT